MAFYWAIMTFFALRSEATQVSGRFCKRRRQQSKQSVPKRIAAHPGRQPARILHVQQSRLDMSSAILQRYVVKLVKLQDLAERLLSCGADCGWQSKAYRYLRPSLRPSWVPPVALISAGQMAKIYAAAMAFCTTSTQPVRSIL